MDKNQIRREIEKHISNLKDYEESKDIVMPAFMKKVEQYINASSASKEFFSKKDVDSLLKEYMDEINRVILAIGDSKKYTPKQIMLNYLEYIRLNGMYENFNTDGLVPLKKSTISGLSQSGINVALFGKGVCGSQSRFLRDLLNSSGQNAIEYDITAGEPHGVTLVSDANSDEKIFLDPTWYNGTEGSLRGSYKYLPENIKQESSILSATQEEIDEAREVAQNYLIEKYGIKEISEKLGLENANDLEKQMRILTFIERNLAPTDEALNVRSAVMGDYEVEVGKLLELFYKANNIPYSNMIDRTEHKENAIYLVNVGEKECFIYPKNAFDKSKNEKALTGKLLLCKNDEGKVTTYQSLSEDNKTAMVKAIREGRALAQDIDMQVDENASEDKKSNILESVLEVASETTRTEAMNQQVTNIKQIQNQNEQTQDKNIEEQE